jgi:SSS family solute:Na+ symporter
MNELLNSRLSTVDLLLLLAYAIVCLVIGFWSSRRQRDEDFLIMGRSMNTWSFVTTVVASYIGGAAIVAYTAFVYRFGIAAISLFIGTALGFLLFIPFARKLREVSGEKQFFTLSDWFYFKYNNSTGLLSAIIMFVVYFGLLTNQFIAGSTILANLSGWSYETALLFSSVIICVYLLAGGFSSVVRTDSFQYIVMIVLFIFLGVILFTGEGQQTTKELVDFSRMDIGMTLAFMVFGVLNMFQSSEYWQRVYAAKSNDVVKRGFRISAAVVLLTGFALTLIGLAAHMHFDGIDPKNAFPMGLGILVPDKILGVGLILIFAAIMSSADTMIFVLSSSLAKDFLGRFSHKVQSTHSLRKNTRLFILLFSIAGTLSALYFRDLINVFIFITGLGFAIVPPVIASFYYNIHSKAVNAAFIAGISYVLVLLGIAAASDNPSEFIKNNADFAILSAVFSLLSLVIAQRIFRRKMLLTKK